MDEINAYEKERLETIAANRVLLEELGLQKDGPSKIPIVKKEPAPAKPRKRKSEVVKVEADDGPRRRSGRLRGLEIDSKELVKIELEEKQQAEEARVRATRPRQAKMSLAQLGVETIDEVEAAEAIKMMASAVAKPNPRSYPTDSSATYADSDTPSAALANLKAAFKGVSLKANAKITPERVFSMAVHPEKTKDLVFVGDKRGMLGIWDATAVVDAVKDEDGEEVTPKSVGKVYKVQAHSINSISAIRVDPVNGSGIFTSSYDCTVRHLDLATGMSTEIFGFPDTDNLITHMDITPSGQEIWCSDKNGGLSHVDIREANKSRRRFRVVEETGKQKLGGVSINPLLPHLLCTAGLDGMVRVWDARHLTQLKTEPASTVFDEPPTETQPTAYSDYDAMEKHLKLPRKTGDGIMRASYVHGKSCTSAYWDPWGRRILTTSYDDKLRIWDLAPSTWDKDAPLPSSHFQPKTAITHNCQTGRWLSVLRAQWSANMDYMPHLTVGNMRRTLDVFAASGEKIVGLWEEGVTAVPAVTASHPNRVDCVVGGNGSGKCQIWSAA